MANIHRIPLGTSNIYLIEDAGALIIVDAGNRHLAKRFFKKLDTYGIRPDQIKLIVITHVHFDHVGSLKAIKDTCQCPVAVHTSEAILLRNGTTVIPGGMNMLGKTLKKLGDHVLLAVPALFRFPAVEPEILVSDEMPLVDFGLAGKIIYTPGHTRGSLSLLLAGGEAFVGDLAVNYLPFNLSPIFPPFADDPEGLIRSWKMLLEKDAQTIYPGHGRPFSAQILRQKLSSRRK